MELDAGRRQVVPARVPHQYVERVILSVCPERCAFILENGFNMLDQEDSHEHTMMTIQLWSEALRSTEVKEALMAATFDTWVKALTEIFQQAQNEGEVDPDLDACSLARIMFGQWHGMLLHKSLDAEIDIKACAVSIRALYQGTFRTSPRAG